jgi:acyl-CoA synthetase (AMP-forming)/AMP-acid ligase II
VIVPIHELDAHARLRFWRRIFRPHDPTHPTTQAQRLGHILDGQSKYELGVHLERPIRTDESAAFGDVARVVSEERVEALVFDIQLDGCAPFCTPLVGTHDIDSTLKRGTTTIRRMRFQDELAELRRMGEEKLLHARIISRVAKKIGMHQAMSLSGASEFLREVLRGKPEPSLAFRVAAKNEPHRLALMGLLAPAGAPRGQLVQEERAYSFFELNERVDSIAKSLAKRGARCGDRIVVMLKNRPEFVLVQTAAARLGCATVSCSYRSTSREFEYVVKDSGARILFFDAEIASVLEQSPSVRTRLGDSRCIVVGGKIEPFPTLDDVIREGQTGMVPKRDDAPSVVMYTSGTTGKPKGAVRKYGIGIMAGAMALIGETPMQMGEKHLAVCPLYHATANSFIALSYIVGSTVYVMRDFRPEAFLEAVERYRITTTAVVPTMLHRIVELGDETIRRYDTSSLKVIFSGGAPLTAPLAREVMRLFGDTLYNFYGSTETGAVTLAKPDDLKRAPGTIGKILDGQHVRLLDEEGRACLPGRVGELYARSGQLITGYHANESGTREAMRDGFFSVGDLARQDERGYFFLEGRKRDMIISGGVNVYPAEVESVLEDHPAIAEAAVVGIPDPEWGERTRAFVVVKQGAHTDSAALLEYCRAQLAGPKVPREFVFLEALPRNPTGKVLKRELREMDASRNSS